jgi:hypothetical protein
LACLCKSQPKCNRKTCLGFHPGASFESYSVVNSLSNELWPDVPIAISFSYQLFNRSVVGYQLG